MIEVVPEGQCGVAKVVHYEISQLDALRDSIDATYSTAS
jgi:hypothetical protein